MGLAESMKWSVVAIMAALIMAGCAGEPVAEPEPANGLAPEVDETTGAVCGVVVDPAVNPLEGVTVVIDVAGEKQDALTDVEGLFCFGKLPPGFYQLEASKAGYTDASIQAQAVANVTNPPLVNIQLNKLFDQDPFVIQFKFEGRLACHVQAGLTAPCVTDWTQLVPGCGSGCVPQLRTVMGDARDFISAVDAGWQAHVVEMVWEPSSQATSAEMGLIIRDFAVGGGTHQFGEMEGTSPLWIRFDVNEVHPTQGGGDPTMIPAEGYDQIIHFAGVRTASGDLVAAAVEQQFTVFSHTFYYGTPFDDWSFVNGDDMPF